MRGTGAGAAGPARGRAAPLTADLHIHSDFSVDSKMSVDELCGRAVSLGLSIVCITDHLDLDPADAGFGYYDYDGVSAAIEEAREKFQGRLTILKGVEFGEPHLHPGELEEARGRGYDMILGSVHCVGGCFVGDPAFMMGRSLAEAYALYYAEVLKSVEAGGFDVLAHLDFPKRYIGALPEHPPIVGEITAAAAAAGIALEINTSPLRKGMNECSPDAAAVGLFARAGGAGVTLGSDAHRPEDVAAGLDEAARSAEGKGVVPGYFRDRNFVPLGTRKKKAAPDGAA